MSALARHFQKFCQWVECHNTVTWEICPICYRLSPEKALPCFSSV